MSDPGPSFEAMQFANQQQVAAAVVRFLLARIDDDELAHERAVRHDGSADSTDLSNLASRRNYGESLAKRRVIGEFQQLIVLRDLPVESEIRRIALSGLCAMTIPYRAHTAWDPMWEAHVLRVEVA